MIYFLSMDSYLRYIIFLVNPHSRACESGVRNLFSKTFSYHRMKFYVTCLRRHYWSVFILKNRSSISYKLEPNHTPQTKIRQTHNCWIHRQKRKPTKIITVIFLSPISFVANFTYYALFNLRTCVWVPKKVVLLYRFIKLLISGFDYENIMLKNFGWLENFHQG